MVIFSFAARAIPDLGIFGQLARLFLLVLMPPIALNHLYKQKNIVITKVSAALGVVYVGVFLFLAYALLYVRGIFWGGSEVFYYSFFCNSFSGLFSYVSSIDEIFA